MRSIQLLPILPYSRYNPIFAKMTSTREAGESREPFTSTMSSVSSRGDVTERLQAMQGRQSRLLRRAIDRAEQHPETRVLDAAQKAEADSKNGIRHVVVFL